MSGISVATIKSPEFVNITSISPLVSKCEIKVLYVGQNRNRSFISKEVATEMAQSLPGVPIVGYYSENKEDFRDHGDRVTIDGDGLKFDCLTKPYGFVAPNAKVWFKEFQDTDDFGNTVLREYLMCEGYLWTAQYEEAKKIINEGRPQSMELDDNTLKGYWSTDNNCGIDFFIINDAIVTKLCTLGTDVEPCFEGASVTKPNISASFTKDEKVFTKTIYSMMQELKELTFALNKEGGEKMELNDSLAPEQEVTPEVKPEENFSEIQDKVSSETNTENQVITEEFKKAPEEEKKEEESKGDKSDEGEKKEEPKEEEDEKKPKTKSTLEIQFEELTAQYTQLKADYDALREQNDALVEYRNQIEDQQKTDLINSFTKLSDEDKKEVIENKSKFSLDEIKTKLVMLCYEKKISFADDEKEPVKNAESAAPITFSLENTKSELPGWLAAVESRRNHK